MQTSDLDAGRLRRLATTRPERGMVLSLYLDLDPSTVPPGRAREAAVTSLLDDVHRAIEAGQHTHEEQGQLRSELARAREIMADPPTEGAHGLAVFLCQPAGLTEVIRLPRPVASGYALGPTPRVAPLAELFDPTRWAVLLASRRTARVLRGTRDALAEVTRKREDWPGRDHDIGRGDPRYEQTVHQEVEDHLHVAADLLFAEFQREAFDALLVGAPDDLPGRLEAHLHPYLRERLAGHLSVDVDATTPDVLLAQARGPMEERQRAHLDELLGRLRDHLGRGERASAGWEDVLAALDERRVETLLLGGGPQTDVREGAVEAAIAQDAEVARVAEEDLAGLGGVAAVHRF